MDISGRCDLVLSKALNPQGFATVTNVSGQGLARIAYLGKAIGEVTCDPSDHTVHLVHLRPHDGLTNGAKDWLTCLGWRIVEHNLPLTGIPPRSTVLILDELVSPVLSNISDIQFKTVKELIMDDCRLLWVTMGYVKAFFLRLNRGRASR
jgi:hypothetical protein